MVRRPKQMSPDPEEIQHESVDREKPLRVRRGFEPAHLSLALSRRLMRNLCVYRTRFLGHTFTLRGMA